MALQAGVRPPEEIHQAIQDLERQRDFEERLLSEVKAMNKDTYCIQLKIAFINVRQEALRWVLKQ